MVDTYSTYTAIVTIPWLHALGAVSSTLHQKVKYSLKGQVKEIVTEEAKCEDLGKIVVSDDLEKFFQVSFQLPP